MICPGGMGRRLPLHSWGWKGQIDDLARMPSILRDARPWLRIDAQRVYAVGGSMGGQETLLLLGRHPSTARGSRRLRLGHRLRTALPAVRPARPHARAAGARAHRGRRHPSTNPQAYRLRSPTHWIEEIARSGRPAADVVERRRRDRRRPGTRSRRDSSPTSERSSRAAASRRSRAPGATPRRATRGSSCPAR